MQLHCADRDVQLRTAILLYGMDGPEGFATVHPVTMEEGVPVIRAGTPASRHGLLQALRTLADDRLPPELLAGHILAKGFDHLVWYRPPERRMIWVRSAELGERCGEIPVPGLIWLVKPLSGDCSVFAYAGANRPQADTVLHQAPFFNVWSDGRICTGNAAVPKGEAALNPEHWEAMFFNSFFSHPNTPRIVRGRIGANEFMKNLLGGKHRVFPKDKLLPLKQTLGQEFAAHFGGSQ